MRWFLVDVAALDTENRELELELAAIRRWYSSHCQLYDLWHLADRLLCALEAEAPARSIEVDLARFVDSPFSLACVTWARVMTKMEQHYVFVTLSISGNTQTGTLSWNDGYGPGFGVDPTATPALDQFRASAAEVIDLSDLSDAFELDVVPVQG